MSKKTFTPKLKTEAPINLNWSDLLQRAITEPGTMAASFTAFHNYSTANRMLALMQCIGRNIQPGPLSTYKGWEKKNRNVKRGEKAIWLYFPINRRYSPTPEDLARNPDAEERTWRTFSLQPKWFVLSQTEGEEFIIPEPVGWDRALALITLEIVETPFTMMNGNVAGYATHDGKLAINPLDPEPLQTTMHELAHHVLGHTGKEVDEEEEGKTMPAHMQEVTAEATALIVLSSLGIEEGQEHARAYIQNWLRGSKLEEKYIKSIFKAADTILKAGRKSDTSATEDNNPVEALAA